MHTVMHMFGIAVACVRKVLICFDGITEQLSSQVSTSGFEASMAEPAGSDGSLAQNSSEQLT